MKTKCMSCGGPTKKMKTGGAAKPKMKLGGTLPKAKDGVTVRDARTGKHKSGPLSCFERANRTNKNRKFWHEGGGKTIKNIGKNILGAGALVGAGAVAYKKSTPFKNAVDELKGKLGFNKTGGAVKKYATGGSIKKKDCPDGYYWNGSDCIKYKGPFHSTGAKLGFGAGVAGILGLATSVLVDARKEKKAKKEKEKLELKALQERANKIMQKEKNKK